MTKSSTTMALAARRAPTRRDRGAALAEAAIIVPLLLAFLFGAVDFGFAWSQQIAVRNGTHAAARAASVGELGTDGSCALQPAPDSTVTARLLCLAKAQTGIRADAVRVKVALTADPAVTTHWVVVCTQYRPRSLSGLYRGVLDGNVVNNWSTYQLEHVDASSLLVPAQEAPLSGTWDWCAA
jgi:Flp pilus assembly protein TadG